MPFPFTDLPGNKMRPALVPALKGSDVTLAFITTKLGWAGLEDFVLLPDAENGLCGYIFSKIAFCFFLFYFRGIEKF